MNAKTFGVKLLGSRHIYPVIFFVALIFYLVFSQLIPVTDPVESNYALAAKEMVLAADWVSPRIYGNVWFDKPVLFYWLTAAAFKAFGFSALAARLAPSVFAAAGLVLIYWFLVKTTKQSIALLAALIMGTSLAYVLLARLIITDMVFFVFNSAALVFFYCGYIKLNGSKRWYLAMYVSLALAVLTKGPVGLLLPGLVIVVFIGIQRNWAELKNMSMSEGALLFAVIALPWYLTMYAKYGDKFISTFFGVHNYLRATVSEHPKDNVSYYYIVVFGLSMLPWSFLSLKGFFAGYKEMRVKNSPLILFSLIWALAYFVFYSFMATKYLTYTFPMTFPAAVLAALLLEQLLAQNKTRTIVYWAGIPLTLLIMGYMVITARYLEGLPLAATLGSLAAALIFTWHKARGCTAKGIIVLLCLCQMSACIILSQFLFPEIAASRSGKEIAAALVDQSSYRIGLYRFYSASLVFYSGNTAVRLQEESVASEPETGTLSWTSKYTMPAATLAEFVTKSPQENILIVVPDKAKEQFLAEAKTLTPKLIKSSKGYSYFRF